MKQPELKNVVQWEAPCVVEVGHVREIITEWVRLSVRKSDFESDD
jgi:hypothetical protein